MSQEEDLGEKMNYIIFLWAHQNETELERVRGTVFISPL